MKMLIFFIALIPFNFLISKDRIEDLVTNIKPSVVTIFTFDNNKSQLGQGTGFFIDRNLIVTNRHVIEGAYQARVKLHNDNYYDVISIIGDDSNWDLALLKVNLPISISPPNIPIELIEPSIGQEIIVIGSPLGLELTVSEGIISSIRNIEGKGKILQISAPISPGSSGSPVINYSGKVIGVVNSSYLEGQNLNFAIPSERIQTIIRYNDKPLSFVSKPIDEHANQIKTKNIQVINQAIVFWGWDPGKLTKEQYDNIAKSLLDYIPDFNEYYLISETQARNIIYNSLGQYNGNVITQIPSNYDNNRSTTSYKSNYDALVLWENYFHFSFDFHSDVKPVTRYDDYTPPKNIGLSLSYESCINFGNLLELGFGIEGLFPRRLYRDASERKIFETTVFFVPIYSILRVYYSSKKLHFTPNDDYAGISLGIRYGFNQIFELEDPDKKIYRIKPWPGIKSFLSPTTYGIMIGLKSSPNDQVGAFIELKYTIYISKINNYHSIYFSKDFDFKLTQFSIDIGMIL